MPPITLDLVKLRELANKASPGPWTVDPYEYRDNGEMKYFPSLRFRPNRQPEPGSLYYDGSVDPYATLCINHSMNQTMPEIVATAEFMAAANPQNIIALLDEYEEQRRTIASLQVRIEELTRRADRRSR